MRYIFGFLLMFSQLTFADEYNNGVEAYQQQQYRKAYEIWLPLAKSGDAIAQYSIGIIYEKGYGVKLDIQQAFDWYKLAAKSGYAKVQYALGNAYYFGKGVLEDHDQALYWWTMAAEQNVVSAQYNLGIMHIYGGNRYRNVGQAKYWLQQASDNGHLPSETVLLKFDKIFADTNPSQAGANKTSPNKTDTNIAKPKIIKKYRLIKKSVKKTKKTNKPIKSIFSKPKKKTTIKKTSRKKLTTKDGTKKTKSVAAKKLKTKKTKRVKSIKSDWISKQPLRNYSLQLTVQPSKRHAANFIKRHHLQTRAVFYQQNSAYKVIYGSYRSRKSANNALKRLAKIIRKDRPWPKSFKVIRQERGY